MINYLPGAPTTESDTVTVDRRINFILHQLNRAHYPRALDIGIGFGTYANRLIEYAEEVVGIDISRENLTGIRCSNKGGSVELLQMSAESLGFPESSFDLVLLIDVIEHLADDQRAISEICRILKPGGLLFMTVPNKLFPFETHGCHFQGKQVDTHYFGVPLLPYLPESWRAHYANARIYTPWRLKQRLGSVGFHIRKTKYIGPNFDKIKMRYPGSIFFINIFQRCSSILDDIPLFQLFSTTIMVCAEKRICNPAES